MFTVQLEKAPEKGFELLLCCMKDFEVIKEFLEDYLH